MPSVIGLTLALARDPPLRRVMVAFAGFRGSGYAVWIAMLVYAYGKGGATAAGVIAVAQLVPAAAVAPPAAALADRRSPVVLLAGGYLVQAIGCMVAAIGIAADVSVMAYGGAIVASTAVVTTYPAQAALIPALVRTPEQLTATNVVTSWIESLSIVIAGLGSGLLLATSGAAAIFAAAATVLLACTALVARIPARGLDVREEGETNSAAGDIVAGFGLLAREPRPRLLVGLITAEWAVIGALDIAFVVLAVSLLHRSDQWVGYLNTAYGAGGVLAGLVSARLVGRRLAPAILVGAALFGVGLALSATAADVVSTIVLLALVGVGRSLFDVATHSLLQRAVPAELIGRVFGVVEGLSMAGLAIGSIVTPLLVATVSGQTALVGVALILPLVVALGGRALFSLDDVATIPVVQISLLRALPLFRGLSAPALEGVARSLERVDVPAGAIVIREGEHGDRFYAIADGDLDISIGGAPVATHGRGESVGEIALLRDVPRTATVTARTPAILYALERDPFVAAVVGHPPTARAADRIVAERLGGLPTPGPPADTTP